MIEVTIAGKKIPVTEVKFGTEPGVFDGPQLINEITVVEQTLTLNVYFYQLLWLAKQIEPQNPKKAKWIRKLAAPHNPLRLAGLL